MIPAPNKPIIPIDVLNQVDIHVGTIEAVDDVPGADKLVQLRVNFGEHAHDRRGDEAGAGRV
jgi:tRNA-binding EMAP/Myf-like protein